VDRFECLGLMDTGAQQGYKPELIWIVRLKVLASELKAHAEKVPRDEHDQFCFLDRSEIKNFVAQNELVQICAQVMLLLEASWELLTG
jgi:hypothetical protein